PGNTRHFSSYTTWWDTACLVNAGDEGYPNPALESGVLEDQARTLQKRSTGRRGGREECAACIKRRFAASRPGRKTLNLLELPP
ncbi:MAG TPA: hypothetical protein PKJ96_08925, partial [Thiobacillaceae bacterium]|nr:hypothetical protein [Thiobacillaceae bacterium]